jgi:hypothetical protein
LKQIANIKEFLNLISICGQINRFTYSYLSSTLIKLPVSYIEPIAVTHFELNKSLCKIKKKEKKEKKESKIEKKNKKNCSGSL